MTKAEVLLRMLLETGVSRIQTLERRQRYAPLAREEYRRQIQEVIECLTASCGDQYWPYKGDNL